MTQDRPKQTGVVISLASARRARARPLKEQWQGEVMMALEGEDGSMALSLSMTGSFSVGDYIVPAEVRRVSAYRNRLPVAGENVVFEVQVRDPFTEAAEGRAQGWSLWPTYAEALITGIWRAPG